MKFAVSRECVYVCLGGGGIEIITLPIVSHSIMRQRCVFARDGDELDPA